MFRYIRAFASEDLDAVVELLDASFFPSTYESRLVRSIHTGGERHCAWVALAYPVGAPEGPANADTETAGEDMVAKIIAYVLYSKALRANPNNGDESVGWHLAPVAVHPEYQRQGIGSELVRYSLTQQPVANRPVFVLGDPHYYERFGFAPVQSVECPYDPGSAHFRALRWKDSVEPFVVGYSTAFKEAELG